MKNKEITDKERLVLTSLKSVEPKALSVKAIQRNMIPPMDYNYLVALIDTLEKKKKIKKFDTSSGPMYVLNGG